MTGAFAQIIKVFAGCSLLLWHNTSTCNFNSEGGLSKINDWGQLISIIEKHPKFNCIKLLSDGEHEDPDNLDCGITFVGAEFFIISKSDKVEIKLNNKDHTFEYSMFNNSNGAYCINKKRFPQKSKILPRTILGIWTAEISQKDSKIKICLQRAPQDSLNECDRVNNKTIREIHLFTEY